MPKVPDDLASSIVFSSDIADLTRQLENILETIADAFNNSINSQETQINVVQLTSVAVMARRGIGILLLLAAKQDGPTLIAALCKPNPNRDATIQTLCSQASDSNQTYSVQWNAGDDLKVSVSDGPAQITRVLWIGS